MNFQRSIGEQSSGPPMCRVFKFCKEYWLFRLASETPPLFKKGGISGRRRFSGKVYTFDCGATTIFIEEKTKLSAEEKAALPG
jgi:hypothetical protein